MNSRLKAALESSDEPIIIGAEQTLITLNDALGAIKDAAPVVVEEDPANLITLNDSLKGIKEGNEADADVPVVEEPIVPAEPVVAEEPVVEEDFDFDLDDLDETEAQVDEDEEELENLDDVKKSLESIALAVRVQVRKGGMTPQIAYTHRLAMDQVLARANILADQYTVSHESFAKDSIAVTLEAERGVLEVLKEVLAKIVAALKAAWASFTAYIKTLMDTAVKIKQHAVDFQASIAGLKFSSEVKAKTVDMTKLSPIFHVAGADHGDPSLTLLDIMETGEKLIKFTNQSKISVLQIINDADSYTAGKYMEVFSAVSPVVVQHELPGGYKLDLAEKINTPLLTQEYEFDGELPVVKVPGPDELKSICDDIIGVSEFMTRYGTLVDAVEKEISDMIKVLEKGEAITDETKAEAIKALASDSKAIIAHVRACSSKYIRLAAVVAEGGLKFVSLCIKQY